MTECTILDEQVCENTILGSYTFTNILTKEGLDEVVEGARDIANQTKHLITEDTLLVYMDKSGRAVRIPYETALKELGVKLPDKRYFLNFSRTHTADIPEYSQTMLDKEIECYIKNKGDFKNVVIVDDIAIIGKSLELLKTAFRNATNKEVSTIALGSGRINPPDYTSDTEGGDVLYHAEISAVADADESLIRKTVRNKPEERKYYQVYVDKAKERFKASA